MVFLDINTFFSPKAGGIRTYHQAKIDWFKDNPAHVYRIVFPGPARRTREEGPVRLEEAWGPALTPDPAGYRLLLDYLSAYRLIRAEKPAVLEAGDPWLTGLFCLLLRRSGLYRGLLVSFYHGDPIPTYLEPWAARGSFRAVKRMLARLAAPLFYALQRRYDLTAVSSRAMEVSLRARGVRQVVRLPFGVAAPFLAPVASRVPGDSGGSGAGGAPVRFLYSGRLDREKGVDLLLAILPDLLALPGVEVSVAGRGAYAGRFAAFSHARFRYLGYLEGAARVLGAYDSHHALLAPGPYETFGLGVLEGMARGLAVIGPDRGGTGELLQEAGSGYLFRADDAADFLRAARQAAEAGPAGLEEEGKRARALAERYGTWDQAIARMVDRYLEPAGRERS